MQEDKLREKIAKKLCEMEGWLWDAIPRESNTLFCSASKSHYYRDADEILAVISGHNRDGISKKGDEYETSGVSITLSDI